MPCQVEQRRETAYSSRQPCQFGPRPLATKTSSATHQAVGSPRLAVGATGVTSFSRREFATRAALSGAMLATLSLLCRRAGTFWDTDA